MEKNQSLFEGFSVQDMISDETLPVLDNQKPDSAEDTPVAQESSPSKTEQEPDNAPQTPVQTDAPDDDVNVLDALKSKFGYDFGEANFEESVDGIYEMSRVAAERMADEQLDAFFKEMPDVADNAQYRANGGDPSKYFELVSQTRDYSQVSMSEKDTMTQRHVLEELLRRQGFDNETRETMLSNMEESGVLYNQAKAALPVLTKLVDAEKRNMIANQERVAQENEAKRREELETIKNTIKVGTLKGIQIPEAEKTKFGAWLMQPDKSGVTPRNAARDRLTLEDKLALEYLVYKGFNLSDLVQKRVETAKAKDLKSLLKDKQGSRMKSDSAQRQDLNIPNIRDLFG